MKGIGERPVLQKIIAVNALVILIGAVVGTWVTSAFSGAPLWFLALGFFLTGCAIMGTVNYLVLRSTFRPLLELSDAMARIHKGEKQRGLPDRGGDPSMQTVSTAVDAMLDRLEGESRRYSAKMFRAIEDERRRIGRELHDDTSQTLAAALINLEIAEKGLADPASETGKRVENSKDLIQYCLGQIKILVYDLRPSMLDDLGLVPALRWYIQSHLDASEIDVETDFELAAGRLPDDVETALYRIAQESLSNVVKHSMASRVSITLEVRPGFASLAIIDNGKGFVPDEVIYDEEGRFGIGLLSIKERVELLDGTVRIDSAHGKGTHVHVVVPLQEGEPE